MHKPSPSTTYSTEVYGEIFNAVANATCPKTGVLDLVTHEHAIVATRNRLIIKDKLRNDDFLLLMGEAVRQLWDVRMELNFFDPEAANA
jgi:hypothetical protein